MRMNRWLRKHKVALLLLFPHLAGVMVFYILPFLWGIVQSFVSGSTFSLSAYGILFANKAFQLAVRNTLLLTALTVPLLLAVSLAVALLVQRYARSGALLLHAFVINYAIPTASIAYVWMLLYEDFGFVNTWLNQLAGIPPRNWLDSALLYVPIISLFLAKYAAYPILLFLGGLQALPSDLYEAADMDGATGFQKFRYLTLPLLVPELLFVAVLGFFFNFKVYKEAYALFGSYPPKSIYLVQHFMNNHFQKLNLDLLTASASVMTVVIGTLIYLLIRLNRRAYFESQ